MRLYFVRIKGGRNSAREQATSYSKALEYLLSVGVNMTSTASSLKEAFEKGSSETINRAGQTVSITVSAEL